MHQTIHEPARTVPVIEEADVDVHHPIGGGFTFKYLDGTQRVVRDGGQCEIGRWRDETPENPPVRPPVWRWRAAAAYAMFRRKIYAALWPTAAAGCFD